MSNQEQLQTSEISVLKASFNAKIERHFDTLDTDPDVLEQLLADKRSPNRRHRARKGKLYAKLETRSISTFHLLAITVGAEY